MDKLTYLKTGKSVLKSIIGQRKYLLKHNKGYLDGSFTKREIANIEYALPKLVSYHQMRDYLHRKQNELTFLIPSTNHKRRLQLRELLNEQIN